MADLSPPGSWLTGRRPSKAWLDKFVRDLLAEMKAKAENKGVECE